MSLFRKKKSADDGLERIEWTEADKALAKSRLEKAEVMSEWPNVERVSGTLTHQLEQNNFGERMRLAMGGK